MVEEKKDEKTTATLNSNFIRDAAVTLGSKEIIKTLDAIEGTPQPTPQKNDSTELAVRQPDSRYKYFIRIKIGGSATGETATTPTTPTPPTNIQLLDQFADLVGVPKDSQKYIEAVAALSSPTGTATSNTQVLDQFAKLAGAPAGISQYIATASPTGTQTSNTEALDQFAKLAGAPAGISQYIATANQSSNALSDSQALNQFAALTGVSKEKSQFIGLAATTASEDKKIDDLPRELIFDSREGHFVGRSEFRLSTSQHSVVKFCLVDPEDKYGELIKKLKNLEVILGFANGYQKNIFVGEVLDTGRRLPGGTLVWAIDPTAKMQDSTSATTVTKDPAATAATTEKKSSLDFFQSAATSLGKPELAKSLEVYENALALAPLASPQKAAATAATTAATTASTATPTAPTTPATPAPTPEVEKKDDLLSSMRSAPGSNSLAKAFTESASNDAGLKFSDRTNGLKVDQMGQVQIQQSLASAAARDAALKGNVLVVRGNTVEEVSPGNAQSSGVTLDYLVDRDAFIGHPTVKRRSPVQLQGGSGFMVRGWNPLTKQATEGVAYTTGPVLQHPTGIIQAPEFGSVKLSDPIVPGSPYTWGDATKNGARVPNTKEIMGGIIRICIVLTDLTKKVGKSKFIINSWYRDPISNREVGGKVSSRHLSGDAIDFYFDGPEYERLFKELWADGQSGTQGWPGGVAKGSGFIHIDDRHTQNKGRARWFY